MKLEQITKLVDGIPHTTAERGATIYNTIVENKFTACLELGFACGVGTSYIAAALQEIGGGKVTSIDLPIAKERKPQAPSLLNRVGLSEYCEFIFHELGYNWYLMDAVENDRKFDFCFLDGAHTWDVDGLAFTLASKVLKPNGIIIFDDLDWCYARSRSMKNIQAPEQMRQTPGIRKVVELLVKPHPDFEWLGEHSDMGIAKKIG